MFDEKKTQLDFKLNTGFLLIDSNKRVHELEIHF